MRFVELGHTHITLDRAGQRDGATELHGLRAWSPWICAAPYSLPGAGLKNHWSSSERLFSPSSNAATEAALLGLDSSAPAKRSCEAGGLHDLLPTPLREGRENSHGPPRLQASFRFPVNRGRIGENRVHHRDLGARNLISGIASAASSVRLLISSFW
jgi:hypothetical protein